MYSSALLCVLMAATVCFTPDAETIVIDPGHGGTEVIGGSSPNNATGPMGTLEKSLTLDVALRVKKILDAQGFKVVLTRERDANLGLAARAQVAKDIKAQAFVSIHFNGFKDPATQGTETYRHKSTEADSGSAKLAQLIQQQVVKATGYRDRGVKTAELGVLTPSRHHLDTAACLVEVSFLTDPNEEIKLGQDAYKQKIAEAIAVGIFDYARKK